MASYKITLYSPAHGPEVMHRDNMGEALAAVESIFQTIEDERLNDSGRWHRTVTVEREAD